jgi:hypothetical protein
MNELGYFLRFLVLISFDALVFYVGFRHLIAWRSNDLKYLNGNKIVSKIILFIYLFIYLLYLNLIIEDGKNWFFTLWYALSPIQDFLLFAFHYIFLVVITFLRFESYKKYKFLQPILILPLIVFVLLFIIMIFSTWKL